MGKRQVAYQAYLERKKLQRMRELRLYGSIRDRIVQQLRVPTLHPTIRLRLLSTIAEGQSMTFKRRFFWGLWSWRGRWTWGIGIDTYGVGLYVGPWSGWFIWGGR